MYEHRGIRGEGDPPPMLGTCTGTLLVVGSGRGVWDDLGRFTDHIREKNGKKPTVQRRLYLWADEKDRHAIMAVNEIGMHLHARVQHWTSLHPEHLLTRYRRRQEMSLPPGRTILHAQRFVKDERNAIDVVWQIPNLGALSGVFAAKVGLLLGYDRVVLAGCPMDGTGCYYDPPDECGDYGSTSVSMAFADEMRNEDIRLRVRSLSGVTRDRLGEPEEMLCAG